MVRTKSASFEVQDNLRVNLSGRHLDLTGKKLEEDGAKNLAHYISRMDICHVKLLNLSDNGIGDDGTIAIAQALNANNTTLLHLKLCKNRISTTGATALARALDTNFTLQCLDLRGNCIQNEGAKGLLDMVADNQKSAITSLNLLENPFVEALRVFRKVAISGEEQKDSSESLTVFHSLTNMIRRNKTLKHLRIASCQGSESPGLSTYKQENGALSEIRDALWENTTLLTFEIQDQLVTDLFAYIQHLRRNADSDVLDLNHSKSLDFHTAVCLARAINMNSSWKSLDLSDSDCPDDNLETNFGCLTKALQTNSTLETLNLARCSIHSHYSQCIAEIIKESKTLKQIDLSGNAFDVNPEDGKNLLYLALEQNSTLQEVNLSSYQLMNNVLLHEIPNGWLRRNHSLQRVVRKVDERVAQSLVVSRLMPFLLNSVWGKQMLSGNSPTIRLNYMMNNLKHLITILVASEKDDEEFIRVFEYCLQDRRTNEFHMLLDCSRAAGEEKHFKHDSFFIEKMRQLYHAELLARRTTNVNEVSPQETSAGGQIVAEEKWTILSLDEKASILRNFLSQTVLTLNFSQLNLGEEEAKIIANLLQCKSQIVYQLSLDDNRISNEGAIAIGESLQDTEGLVNISLANNEIGDLGVCAIAAGLRNNKMLDGLELILDNNRIGNKGICALSKAMQDNECLVELSLSNNEIGDDGVIGISLALRDNKMLEYLNLDNNRIDKIGAGALGKAMQYNEALGCLSLANNTIGDDGVSAIVEGLSKNEFLDELELNLDGNGISSEGARTLGNAMQDIEVLGYLSLSNNDIDNDGAFSLAECLEGTSTLRMLTIDNNRIGNMGALAFGKALRNNQELGYLSLKDNVIGDKGLFAMADAIQKNERLEVLNLDNNLISKQGVCTFCKALQEKEAIGHISEVGKGTEDEDDFGDSDIQTVKTLDIFLSNDQICSDGVRIVRTLKAAENSDCALAFKRSIEIQEMHGASESLDIS